MKKQTLSCSVDKNSRKLTFYWEEKGKKPIKLTDKERKELFKKLNRK